MIKLYVDGASAGNPGASGVGVVILVNGSQRQLSHALGCHNNHEAEFLAVIWGLEQCQDFGTNHTLQLCSDSQAVIAAINKRYAKKAPYADYIDRILTLLDAYPLVFCTWLPRAQNKKADQLARSAINTLKKP
ncbi:ribonuclease HI family protein [Brochothrix campestris]|uniref:Ribonuclease HI n=1 Tax=Brochothrix campestris FSL F6-1037 TaxID=1265861 RepID=W7CKG3_9LIST|nr:ribonuclease HI family protein [Brochothrix campestris]EUJ36311.1 ribonuclease HI [Brochothrix campestris FSL F6-1037]